MTSYHRNSPVVLSLSGATGVGKSTLLNEFSQSISHKKPIQIMTPAAIGEVFDPERVDWKKHSAVAVDEICMWDLDSVRAGISFLETAASNEKKKLILVTQAESDLDEYGIKLTTKPAKVHLLPGSKVDDLSISFDGRNCHFTPRTGA